jgi:hypothetical protein
MPNRTRKWIFFAGPRGEGLNGLLVNPLAPGCRSSDGGGVESGDGGSL